MNGEAMKLVAYMGGANTRFIIPVYQRNYDWKLENCKQLFEDLVKAIQHNRKTHFFGSIVSVHCPGSFADYQIIDGQQRLTTISLLFLAMYHLMKSGEIVSEDESLADMIYETYLINKFRKEDKRIRLKPVKNDQKAFEELFKDDHMSVPDSNLTINYNFFCDQIRKERITIDELYTAITRLEIINITLNNDDNPQMIFESLNSTGLALSEGDKIRNFILMGLSVEQQNEYYENYWNPIELSTSYDVSAFVREYLSVKQQAIPAMSKVYVTFKSYVEEENLSTKLLLEDMKKYAGYYGILLRGTGGKSRTEKALNDCIYRLNRLETTVTRPFFMEVLRLNHENILSIDQVEEIFRYTESYLFRRMICDLPTNTLNKIFLMLHREIIRYDGTTNNYVEKFKYALLSKTERGQFPRDEEFTNAFSTRQVYLMNRKNKIYILERFENEDILEDKAIYAHCDDGTYSIEHIMPQHLTPLWMNELGPDYEEIHEQWLHRIANLTLTAYNSDYSNKPFAEKRDCEKGFHKSGLRMNTWIAEKSKWTLAELEARNSELMKTALKVWALPETNYKPAEKQLDCYTLDDDVDLSGREIQKFEYINSVQPVSSWLNMQEQILRILHETDKSVLSRLAHTKDIDDELSTYVSDRPSALRKALQIDTNIYLERNTSTNTKLSMLRRLFKEYGANPEDLVFYLKDAAEDKTEHEAGTRYELRRKYWAFALKFIHEAHETGGSFDNVNPTKENWINGSFGISGFYITCVANYDQARIDLTLGKSDIQKNKSAFDYLYARRQEIEQKLGTAVEWQRSEDTKASYVVYRLPGVGVDKETDWTQMAKFHAEWSKKFYDVFVPLLRQWNA